MACRISWANGADVLEAREVRPSDVAPHAAELAAWYDEPHNRAMMSNSGGLTADDVMESIGELAAAGGRPFLLYRDGALVGDGDFRHVGKTEAEFAIMIGPRTAQGLGLGTRFSVMMHAFAFRVLALDVVYLSIVPDNVAGRRCYEKVGYEQDGSCPASRYADHVDDVTMSLPRARFEALHAAALAQISIEAC
jgi:RimJ/RimL family protein N-acetyltransferase